MKTNILFLKTIALIFWIILAGCKGTAAKNIAVPEKTTIDSPKEAKNEIILDFLSKKSILSKLFDNPAFDKDSTAIWKPNFQERMDLPVSSDGNCHTTVDTILYFTDHSNRDCAVIILATYQLDEEHHKIPEDVSGSHFEGVRLGIALVSESGNSWKLYEFQKYFAELGYFGTYRTGRQDAGKISLKTIGDRWTCLSLVQGIGGSTGVFSGFEQLFSIEEYKFNNQETNKINEWYFKDKTTTLLTYNYYESGYGVSLDEYIETNIEMKIIPKKNDYYDIDLLINKDGKKSTDHYVYSEKYNQFILIPAK